MMGDTTVIEWTDATWNPVTGCTAVSSGCDHCYAQTLAERFRGTPGHYFEHGFDVEMRPGKLEQPLRWSRPRRLFVNSMSDLFGPAIPDDYIARVFAVIALAQQHTFQLLTKRPARMRSLLQSDAFRRLRRRRHQRRRRCFPPHPCLVPELAPAEPPEALTDTPWWHQSGLCREIPWVTTRHLLGPPVWVRSSGSSERPEARRGLQQETEARQTT